MLSATIPPLMSSVGPNWGLKLSTGSCSNLCLPSIILGVTISFVNTRIFPHTLQEDVCSDNSQRLFPLKKSFGHSLPWILPSEYGIFVFSKRNLWNLSVYVLYPPLSSKLGLCYSASEFRGTQRGNNCLSFWRSVSSCSEMYSFSFSTNLAREFEDQ